MIDHHLKWIFPNDYLGLSILFIKLSNIFAEENKEVVSDYINMKWDYLVCVCFSSSGNLDLDARKPVFGVGEKQRRRPACASMQTAQHLCYSLIGKWHV